MEYDNETISKNEMSEIACHCLQVILEKYEKSDSGKIRGYLLMNETGDVLTKKELRKIQVRETEESHPSYLGRSMCFDPDLNKRTLTNMMLSYIIYNELMAELKKYKFKKLHVFLTHKWEYRYYKDRLWKYRETEYGIPLLEVKIDW